MKEKYKEKQLAEFKSLLADYGWLIKTGENQKAGSLADMYAENTLHNSCLVIDDGTIEFYEEVCHIYMFDDNGEWKNSKIFEGRFETPQELRVVMKTLGYGKLSVQQKSILLSKEFLENIPRWELVELMKEFDSIELPTGWISIEDHLPQWMGNDIMKGYTEYKVKDNVGEMTSRVTDHQMFYYYAKEVGITHWWNENSET